MAKIDFEKLALEYHSRFPAGKIATSLTKPVTTQEELSLAYSPGVAGPCREIDKNKELSFTYTGRGNLVGVVTNGTAVLGLGNIGPYAAKPVMEGKGMLFKKFANIDVFDIELQCDTTDDFIKAVRALEPTFGGINLEDIKAPECFYIEEALTSTMSIPVFHDDQHGTAIIAASAFLNALEVTGRSIETTKVVFSGGGAAAIACANIFLELGLSEANLLMCDSKGVITKDRMAELNPYKAKFAANTSAKTLEDALAGADAFIGVSAPNVVSPQMISKMAPNPIIFALSNPDPEIDPAIAKAARPDAIIATGRSDYPNQVNNVLGFPYIFRGALDVQARCINKEMKLAAVKAIAALAKEEVPEEVLRVYSDKETYGFGRDYLIPKPVDPRVLTHVAPAVAEAAIASGAARRIIDIDQYRQQIENILGPTKRIFRKIRNEIHETTLLKKRKPIVVISHGHDARVIKAAAQISSDGDVDTILIGSRDQIVKEAEQVGVSEIEKKSAIIDNLHDSRSQKFAEQLLELRQRKGVTRTIAHQLLRNSDYFAAMMVKNNLADAMVTGLVEPYVKGLRPLMEVLGVAKESMLCGIQMVVYDNKLYFFSDCAVNIDPTAEELAQIAVTTAQLARRYTDEDIRVAMLSFSSFGSNRHEKVKKVADAVEILKQKKRDFIFDGEIQANVALNPSLQNAYFPFCELKGRANVLIFPDLTSANICYKILANLIPATATGPILVGLNNVAQIIERDATTEETINLIYLAANQAFRR
ncbi:MAG: phosphate acyltransferase [Oligoflexales bacterium]